MFIIPYVHSFCKLAELHRVPAHSAVLESGGAGADAATPPPAVPARAAEKSPQREAPWRAGLGRLEVGGRFQSGRAEGAQPCALLLLREACMKY